jgi:hypothetical protein
MAQVRLDNIAKTYGPSREVDDLSLTHICWSADHASCLVDSSSAWRWGGRFHRRYERVCPAGKLTT